MIEVDAGEEAIIFHLTRKKIPHVTSGAFIGDMRKDDTVIERKEINDFFQSMGEHLTNQYMDMAQYPHKFLIISGGFDSLYPIHRPKIPQFVGMIARLARQGITVLHVQDDAMLVNAALAIFDKAEKLPTDFRIVKRDKNPLRGIIKASAPRITGRSLECMIKKFKTPLGVALASEAELRTIEKVGPTTARRIWENFRKTEDGEIIDYAHPAK
jgi:ERCC4-type nuclease